MERVARRNKVADLLGAGQLAVSAVSGLTRVVENLHHNIARAPGPLATVVRTPMRGVSGLVYRSIRGVTRVVGGGLDLALGALSRALAEEPSSERRDALLAALNGVLGDHLDATNNPLAIPMRLRRGGVALELTPAGLAIAIPQPGPRVVIMVHGLCRNDLQWRRKGHDHGAALQAAAGAGRAPTVLYLHYNTGRSLADNGRDFAGLLDSLVQAWPVPLEEIAIVAHSMGGLVARSACTQGAGHGWLARLRTIVFLGTPHTGAPLERGGNWVDSVLDASPYTAAFAKLGRLRSAGITDLRHGMKEALPDGVTCYAIAGSLGRRAAGARARQLGDGLVPLDSALGHSAGPAGGALFPESHQSIAYATGHLALLSSKKVSKIIGVRLQLS